MSKMNKKILISGLLMAALTVFAAADPKYISPNSDGVQDELVIKLPVLQSLPLRLSLSSFLLQSRGLLFLRQLPGTVH